MRSQSYLEFLNRWEIAVVGDQPAGNSPYALCRVEFGRIGWQENPHQTVLVLDEEIFQDSRFVPFSVVQNQVYLLLSGLKKIAEKVAKGLAVEGRGIFGKKNSRFQVNRSKEANLLAGRRRGYTRLLTFGCPHPCQAAVPLEMNLVFAPKLNIGILQPLGEVFLKASCLRRSAS